MKPFVYWDTIDDIYRRYGIDEKRLPDDPYQAIKSSRGDAHAQAVIHALVRKALRQDKIDPDADFQTIVSQSSIIRDLHRFITNALKDQSQANSFILTAWQHVQFEAAGRHVYFPSSGLTGRLMNTRLPWETRSVDDLRLPYRTIYIAVPRGVGMSYVTEQGDRRDILGITVTERGEYEGHSRSWTLSVVGDEVPAPEKDVELPNYLLFGFDIPLKEGGSIEGALEEKRRLIQSYAPQIRTPFFEKHGVAPIWESIFHFVMTVVLYATCPDVEWEENISPEYRRLQEQMKKHPKGSHKYERAKEALRRTNPERHVVLGRSVTPLEQPPPVFGPGGELLERVNVQGHFRRVVHGKGRSERKWQWIADYWKGPEDAEVPERTIHILKSPTSKESSDGRDQEG